MLDQNKRNIHYFEGSPMNELYERMDAWQNTHQKRFLSLSVQADHDRFCCIALTNPSEVVITDGSGRNAAWVNTDGTLAVKAR